MTLFLGSVFVTDEHDGFADGELCTNVVNGRLCLGTVRQILTILTIEFHFIHRLIVCIGGWHPCVLQLVIAFFHGGEEIVRRPEFRPIFVNDGKQPRQGFSDHSEERRLIRKFDEIVLDLGDIRVCERPGHSGVRYGNDENVAPLNSHRGERVGTVDEVLLRQWSVAQSQDVFLVVRFHTPMRH